MDAVEFTAWVARLRLGIGEGEARDVLDHVIQTAREVEKEALL